MEETTIMTEESTNLMEISAETTKENISHINRILTAALNYIKAALPTIIFAVIIFIIGLLISRVILKILIKAFKRSRMDETICGFLESLIKIVLYMIVIIISLTLLNVPMTSIITILGTAGVAIGLALKDSLSNVAGGFIILFSKPLKAGDSIQFDGTTGVVEEVGILYTKLRTYDNSSVYIPNGKISDGKIINYSEKETRRVDLEFSVGYNDDIDKVRNVLQKIIDGCELILKDPKADILVARHDESAIVFFVRPWVRTDDYWTVYFYLTEHVKKEFDVNKIEIPFTQIDIHNV